VPAGGAIAAPPAPPLRHWDVDGVVWFRADRGNGPDAHVRLAIQIDPTAGHWRVAIAREGSETLVLSDEPRADDSRAGAAGRESIMSLSKAMLSASFPVVDGAGTLLSFSRKNCR
jgi:hypothetical protein